MRIAAGLALLLSVGTSACTSSGAGEVLTDATKTSSIRPADDATGKPLRTDAGMAAAPDAVAALLARDDVKAVKAGRHLATTQTASDATARAQSAEPAMETEPLALAEKPVQMASAAAFANQPVHSPRFSDAKPVKFGRVKPEHFEVHGVDVSRWQGDIDWARLKRQGANFAWIKATDGDDHSDPAFRRNWNGAARAGVPRGAYHFFYWCSPAEAQADWFIRNVPKVKGALPPVLDVEWNHDSRTCRTKPSRAKVLAKMKVFLDKVEAHYGQRPIIYTAPDFYEDNLEGAFTDYPFWLRSVAAHPAKVYGDRDFAFWQYSGTGLASGVNNHIDLNAFNGSADGWKKWIGRSVVR
jgi:lysozyme